MPNVPSATFYTNRFLESIAPELVVGYPPGRRTTKPIKPPKEAEMTRVYEAKMLNPKQVILRTRGNTIVAIVPVDLGLARALSSNSKAYVYGTFKDYQFSVVKFAPYSAW